MMRSILIVVLTLMLFSCSTPDTSDIEEISLQFGSQKWELVRMTGSFINSETTGDDMEWQEYYIFNPEGTFLKSREREGVIIEASGTFDVVEYDNDEADYLELTYKTGHELIGSCNGDGKEELVYRTQKELSNTWQACDGPGLDYVLEED